MVEASLGLLLLLFVVFGILEFGQLIMARQIITNSARAAARIASSGSQPTTYPDGTPTPSPGGIVTTAFLTTYVNKALAVSPLSGVTPQFYGANSDGSPNTSLAWNSASFGNGFFVDVQASYIPLFSGSRFYADGSGNKGPIVGSTPMRFKVFFRSEGNF